MIVADIFELNVQVLDRGIANLERIAIYVKFPLNIGQYGLMIGTKEPRGSAFPVKDQLFWFGDGQVNTGDWIFVYTGPGEPQISDIPNNNAKLYSVHWGKQFTVFQAEELVPILFRVDAVFIPEENEIPKPPQHQT